LAAVADCRDPRGAVDVGADVALVGDDGLARVHADADSDRAAVQPSLHRRRRVECLGRTALGPVG
jgi:hypothetical protein